MEKQKLLMSKHTDQIESDMARIFGISRNILSQATVYRISTIYNSVREFCTNLIILICIILFMICLFAIVFRPPDNTINILLINTDEGVIHQTNDRYLSIGLDSSVIADGFFGFDMNNHHLIALTRHLSPGILRVGGTLADRLRFIPGKEPMFKSTIVTQIDGGRCSYENQMCIQNRPNYTMSGEEWLQLNNYARRSGFNILFDLNALIRHNNGSWDSDNAELLIKFSYDHNLTVLWQLGNEPNAFRHVFNYAVNATQLAKDFKVLRNILEKYTTSNKTLITGPDTTRPQLQNEESARYLKEFLKTGKGVIDVVSWHQYYMNGRTASLRDFLNPYIFNLLNEQIDMVWDILRTTGTNDKPLWLTETSSAYGGGSPGYSDSYIGSFIWLDKLGMAAKKGLDLVVRQSIFKGDYALIGWDYEPNPDWWISVLYKKIVGPKVVSCNVLSSVEVRLYCQCASKDVIKRFGSAITIYGMNLREITAKIRLQGIYPNNDQTKVEQRVYAYILTAYYTILSRHLRLNGVLLQMNGNDLPPMVPIVMNSEPYLTIPPYSMVFWIVPNSEFKFCK